MSLLDAGDDGIIVVEFDGAVRRYWNHDPLLLAGRNDNHVELHEGWGMLGTRLKTGYWPFYLADPDDHRT